MLAASPSLDLILSYTYALRNRGQDDMACIFENLLSVFIDEVANENDKQTLLIQFQILMEQSLLTSFNQRKPLISATLSYCASHPRLPQFSNYLRSSREPIEKFFGLVFEIEKKYFLH